MTARDPRRLRQGKQSSSEWAKRSHSPAIKTVRLSNPRRDSRPTAPQLNQEADYVVADGPGSTTRKTRAAPLPLRAGSGPGAVQKPACWKVPGATGPKPPKRSSTPQEIRSGQPKKPMSRAQAWWARNYRLTKGHEKKPQAGAWLAVWAKDCLDAQAEFTPTAPGQGAVCLEHGEGTAGPLRPPRKYRLFFRLL